MKGSIKRRGNSWRGRIEVGVDPATGKRRFRSVTKSTKRDVEKALAKISIATDAGTYIDPQKTTFGDWLDEWYENTKDQKRPSTLERYRGIINTHLKPKLGRLMLQRLRATDLERYYRESTLEPSGLELHQVIIRAALASAKKKKLVTDNEATLVDGKPRRRDKNDDVRQNCWTSEEARTFLNAAKDAGPQQGAFYLVALEIGLRRNEIAGLKWQDVNLDAGTLTLKDQLIAGGPSPKFGPLKSGAERTLEITPELASALHAHKVHQSELKMKNRATYRDHGLVFARELSTERGGCRQPASIGEPVAVKNISSREFARLVEEAKVKKIKFHGLRHTAATLALIAGVNVKTVSYRLGHSKIAITLDLYSHVVPELQKAEVEKLRRIRHG